MCILKGIGLSLVLLAAPCFAQVNEADSSRLPQEMLMPGEHSDSWFQAEQFTPKPAEPLPLEESLAQVELPRQAFTSLKGLFVGQGVPDMDMERQAGSFAFPGGSKLMYGYDRKLGGQQVLSDEYFLRRNTVYGAMGPDFHDLADQLYQDDSSWSVYYGGRFVVAPRLSLDLGAYYEELASLDPTAGDVENLNPRYGITYDVNSRVRIQLAGGTFSEYGIFGYEDTYNHDQALLGNGSDIILADLFNTSLENYGMLSLEMDFTKRTTLRLEGFKSSADKGMNMSLRHRR